MFELMIGKRLMAEEPGASGEGKGGGGEPSATDTDAHSNAPTENGSHSDDSGDKPFLGGDATECADKPDTHDGEKPSDDGAKDGEGIDIKSLTDDDYVKAISKDTSLLGDDNAVNFHEPYIKGMAQVFREEGVSPKSANKIANAFAKMQIDEAKESLAKRREYFEKMNQVAMRTYSQSDWRKINAAIDANFKKDGAMNYTIRNSELGADPEFLAFLLKVGATNVTDTVAGATDGVGGSSGDPNTYNGISKMW